MNKLALPPHLHIHDVFHVNLLKQYVANPEHVLDADDTILVNQEEFSIKPGSLLEIKEKPLCHRTICMVLVKWNGYPIEDASWEYWDTLVAQFSYLKG